MAFFSLSGDQQRSVFHCVCNLLDPRDAVALSSVDRELWASTQALLQQLKTKHEAAAALCLKVGKRSCKELRETKAAHWFDKGLTAADLALLGTLGSVLPALEDLRLIESSKGATGPDGMQRLAEVLSAGALPTVTYLSIGHMHVGDAGASALAAALGRGALPRLKTLFLANGAITDAALVALAPALRRLPALEVLNLNCNPCGDEGLAALVAPPLPASAPPTTTGVLTKLERLSLCYTQVSDAGCAALAVAFDSGALPALELVYLGGAPASDAAKAAVGRAGLEVKL